MRKAGATFRALLLVVAIVFVAAVPAQAQVTLSQATGPNFSLTNSVFPVYTYPVATVTANGTAKFNIGSVSVISIRVTGTYSAANTAIQVSNDNTNFTTLTLLPVGGGAEVSALTANGLFVANVAGMTQIQINNTGTFTGTSQIIKIVGSATQGPEIPLRPVAADPCQDPAIQKQSVAISGTAPNATKAIPLAAGKQTFVCDISVVTGTSATSTQIKAGTQTTNPCDTGAVNLTGAMPVTTGFQLLGGWGGAVFGAPQIPLANDVCVFVAGGTAVYAGWATFVQQ